MNERKRRTIEVKGKFVEVEERPKKKPQAIAVVQLPNNGNHDDKMCDLN